MPVAVYIPGSLRNWFGGADEATATGSTVGECLADLARSHPSFDGRLNEPGGGIATLLIFVNGDNVMKDRGLETPVSEGDTIGIIPLAAGG